MSAFPIATHRRVVEAYVFEQQFQLLVLVFLDKHMLVVDVFNDKVVSMLVVDPDDDGLDGGITLDEHAFGRGWYEM